MAINLISEKYEGSNGLKANVGDWVNGELVFKTTTEHEFNSNSSLYYRDATGNNGGAFELELQQGNWSLEGFSAGDEIEIEVRVVKHTVTGGVVNTDGTQSGGVFSAYFPIQIKYKATIIYLDSDVKKIGISSVLELSDPAQVPYVIIPFATPQSTIVFTSSDYTIKDFYSTGVHLNYQYSFGSVRKTSRPDEIELLFNLTPNNSTSQSSVINGQVNRFRHELPTSTSLVAVPMQQLNSTSGGYFKSVLIEQTQDLGATTEWKLSYKFMQWGLVEDGYSEPNYNDAGDCLAPIGLIKVFANAGNPNGLLQKNTSNNIGNTGGFDESFNGGQNLFSVVSTDWFSSSGASISALDYSAASTFKAIVETGGTQTPLHGYKLGLSYRPEDSTVYDSVGYSLQSNLMINAPEVLFRPTGLVDATVYSGVANSVNAGFDFSDVKITIVGTTLEVEGVITPIAGNSSYFGSIADGGRNTTLWLSIATEPGYLGTVQTPGILNRVSLKLFNQDNIDAPIVGVQIPNIVSQELYDHDLNPVTQNQIGNTTTEDDVLYVSEFLLPEHVAYSGMRTRITAFNSLTGDEFILENNFISFGSLITQNGVIQANETISRNFNLPPTSDRNKISIVRKPSLDTVGFAGYQLDYGFLNDWRYWLSQSNVDSYFYDLSEPNNGLNKNWQKFYTGNWLLRVSYFTDLDGIEDFNNYSFKIRPYEDDVDVSEVTTLTVLSNGTNPTGLIYNEIIEVETVFSWPNLFTDVWVEFTSEDQEGGNRWVISSVLDQGNVSANPWKPLSGETKIQVTGTGTNTLTCKALIDTSIISADAVCLSYRVYSSPNESGPEVKDGKLKTDGTYKLKTDGTIKLKA